VFGAMEKVSVEYSRRMRLLGLSGVKSWGHGINVHGMRAKKKKSRGLEAR